MARVVDEQGSSQGQGSLLARLYKVRYYSSQYRKLVLIDVLPG